MAETIMTLKITNKQKAKLRQIAKQYGFTIGRGNEKEWGSVRKLMAAVADGKLHIVKLGSNGQ